MDPEIVIVTQFLVMQGKNTTPGTPGPPAESPLKVWTGSEWAPAGVKVED